MKKRFTKTALALILAGAASFVGCEKNTQTVDINYKRYFVTTSQDKTQVTINPNSYTSINLVDEGSDGSVDYKECTMLGPKPIGARMRLAPLYQDQNTFDYVLKSYKEKTENAIK